LILFLLNLIFFIFLLVPVIHLTSSTEKEWKEDPQQIRKDQLKVIFDRCEKEETIIVGDFNIGREEEFNNVILPEYIDCWPHLNKDEDGFTFDPNKNNFASSVNSISNGIRVDRVLMKSNSWNLSHISLFGSDPFEIVVEDKPIKINLSDHFGIFSKFESK
jgi:endonuclease/exonuclease/phosphatase family metal-dependent hydrolase